MSRAKTNGRPSDRDQFWLDHQAAQASSGQTAKEYAAAHDLSLHAFYQARKRLRALGLLDPPASEPRAAGRRAPGKKVSFSKMRVASSQSESRFRLELPGGLALVWDGGDVPASVISLVERLALRP